MGIRRYRKEYGRDKRKGRWEEDKEKKKVGESKEKEGKKKVR